MPRRLLLVDDEPNMLETTRFILEAAGHEVWTARTGEDALAAARCHGPEVLLLDIMMPRMDGFAVCRAVRRDPALAGMEVVFLTAKGQREDERRALEAGANAFMRKPLDEVKLLALLERPDAG